MTRNAWGVIAVLLGAFVFAFGGSLVAGAVSSPSPAVAGEQGPQGPAGANGSDGADGADGVDGVDGKPGLRGATGATGATGAQGAKGVKGDPGATGPIGAPGSTGPAGPSGQAGPAGPAGPAGQDGAVGPTGPAGPAGSNGPRSYAVIVHNPATVVSDGGMPVSRYLANLDVTEGTWIVTASWSNMRTTNTDYACFLGNSQNSQVFQMLNFEPSIDSYSMTQVFTVPRDGSTMSLACAALNANEVKFSRVSVSAIEVTG